MSSKYIIKVKGLLSDNWTDLFDGIVLDLQNGPGDAPITVLTCQVQDQAELTGILNWIHNINLTLLEVTAIREEGNDV